MVGSPQERGDAAQGAEYWRREADRLQAVVYALKDRIAELTEPIIMVFQGVDGEAAYERSVVRIPEDQWDAVAEQYPHRKSWDWTTTGGLMFLLSPVVTADARRCDEAVREN
jgi:hypothetical protein